MKEQRVPVSRSQSLPWQRCSLGAQVAPQRCPILRLSAVILTYWLTIITGRFFVIKVVGFSIDKNSTTSQCDQVYFRLPSNVCPYSQSGFFRYWATSSPCWTKVLRTLAMVSSNIKRFRDSLVTSANFPVRLQLDLCILDLLGWVYINWARLFFQGADFALRWVLRDTSCS